MRILARDVGKSKRVAYTVDTATGECGFGFKTVGTRPAVLARVFAEHRRLHGLNAGGRSRKPRRSGSSWQATERQPRTLAAASDFRLGIRVEPGAKSGLP